MAKVSFTKLNLAKNQEIKTLEWNGQTIEIKQYLPIIEILEAVSSIINNAHDSNSNFSNPIKVDVYTTLEILYRYTNINFTEKQKEDVLKLYDTVVGSGLYQAIIDLIPEEEIEKLKDATDRTITSVYAYQNSILGILDTISADYSAVNLNLDSIQEKLNDPNSLQLIREILPLTNATLD